MFAKENRIHLLKNRTYTEKHIRFFTERANLVCDSTSVLRYEQPGWKSILMKVATIIGM